MNWTGFIALIPLTLALAGCEQPLFPANTPRSQYERYQYQREGFTPEQREAIFGQGDEIDLRARLKPLDQR